MLTLTTLEGIFCHCTLQPIKTECEAYFRLQYYPPKTGYDLQSIVSQGLCSEVSAFLHLDTSGEVIRFRHHCKT